MYIAVEGNIGAGKSTLASALSKRIEALLVLEKFENHPSLQDFYEGKSVNLFEMEEWFLKVRHDLLKKAFSDARHKFIVSDFWFEKSMIFANTNLKERDKMEFAKLFYSYQNELLVPDILIFIDSQAEMLQKSIGERNREIEKNIKEQYLFEISTAYKKRLAGLRGTKIISLNMDELRQQPLEKVVEDVVNVYIFGE